MSNINIIRHGLVRMFPEKMLPGKTSPRKSSLILF